MTRLVFLVMDSLSIPFFWTPLVENKIEVLDPGKNWKFFDWMF